MRFAPLVFLAPFAALAFAFSDEPKPSPSPVPSSAEPAVLPAQVVEFGNGARFRVMKHDRVVGSVTVHVADDPVVKLSGAPVVSVPSDAGPQTLTFVPVEGRPGTWRLASPLLRAATLDGSTMKIVVGDKTYAAPFLAAAPAAVAPPAKHDGGRMLMFECGAYLEVVRDPDFGSLAIYAPTDMKTGDPQVLFVGSDQPATKVVAEGQPGVWTAWDPRFKAPVLAGARVRLTIDGEPCEVELTDGQVFALDNGLHLQVAPVQGADTYVVRFLDADLGGTPYTIENPRVVVRTSDGERSVVPVPVEGVARAWRLVMPAGVVEGFLRFTLRGSKDEVRVVFARR